MSPSEASCRLQGRRPSPPKVAHFAPFHLQVVTIFGLERSLNTRDAGLHELWSKVPLTPTLLGVEWVPIASLFDAAWCHQRCHGFSLDLIAAARPLLPHPAAWASSVVQGDRAMPWVPLNLVKSARWARAWLR